MTEKLTRYGSNAVEDMILTVRAQKVILDRDLAALYGVPTFRFNEAVKRNRRRFPEDFMFQLTAGEYSALTSQIAMAKPGRGRRRTPPFAFTEPTCAASAIGSHELTFGHSFAVFGTVRR